MRTQHEAAENGHPNDPCRSRAYLSLPRADTTWATNSGLNPPESSRGQTTSQKATKTVTRKQRPRLGPGPPPARREPILHSMSWESACQLPMTQPMLIRSAQKVPGCTVQALARMACRTPEDTTPTHMASVDKAGRPGCMPTCQANAHPTGPGRGSRSWWNPGAKHSTTRPVSVRLGPSNARCPTKPGRRTSGIKRTTTELWTTSPYAGVVPQTQLTGCR